jgi:3-oxoacyl-[acyl-carrier protein] reductase
MQLFSREAEESRSTIETIIANRTKEIPLGKLIQPDDIAAAVLFFCSPMANMITGQSIAVDGGSGEAVMY